MKQVNFNTTENEDELIIEITKRVHVLHPGVFCQLNLQMDLTACHCNGNPIDFEKLLSFDDFNFNHDIFGITNCINRRTGKLENCFVPRCSK